MNAFGLSPGSWRGPDEDEGRWLADPLFRHYVGGMGMSMDHGQITRASILGGKRGGERRALNDRIALTIVERGHDGARGINKIK